VKHDEVGSRKSFPDFGLIYRWSDLSARAKAQIPASADGEKSAAIESCRL
jgi:hypothetical protein